MKTIILKSGLVLAALGTAAAAQAQDNAPWYSRIGLSYRGSFNVSASFTGLGGLNSLNMPGGPGEIAGAPGTVVRTYDNGFIGIDASGNAGGATTFWGYNNSANQVVGDNVLMKSSSATTASTGNVDDGPLHGMELSYFQPLGGKDRWHWGVEGALNWTPVDIHDNRTLSGSVVSVTHSFALNGVLPPPAGVVVGGVLLPAYVGPVNGPGAPQLSDSAVDVSGPPAAGAETIAGYRKIEADMFGLRIGPYVEYDLTKVVSVDLSAGFSAAILDSDFSYSDTVTALGLPATVVQGSSHSVGGVFGGYVRGQVNFRICKAATFFTGAEFNSLTDFSQSAGQARAQLHLGSTFNLTGGFNFNF